MLSTKPAESFSVLSSQLRRQDVFLHSFSLRVQLSQPYVDTGHTSALISNNKRFNCSATTIVQTAVGQGSRSDRPRYHTHGRRNSPLPLASVVPRHKPRRASPQLTTSRWRPTATAVNQYSCNAAANTHVEHTDTQYCNCCIDLRLERMTLTYSPRRDMATTNARAKIEVVGHLFERQVETDGRTQPIALPCPLKGR